MRVRVGSEPQFGTPFCGKTGKSGKSGVCQSRVSSKLSYKSRLWTRTATGRARASPGLPRAPPFGPRGIPRRPTGSSGLPPSTPGSPPVASAIMIHEIRDPSICEQVAIQNWADFQIKCIGIFKTLLSYIRLS